MNVLEEHHASSVMNCIHDSSLSSSSMHDDDDGRGTSGDIVSYSFRTLCELSINVDELLCPC